MLISHLKKLLLFILLLFTFSCTVNKISNTHGFRLIEKKYDKILINKTNKNDVRNMIGPPSSKSKFDDTWIYIERKKTNQSLVKLGKKRIDKNNVMLIKFNSMGLVSDKEIMDISKMNDIKIAQKKTIKKYEQDDFFYNILSVLREKINAPTRNKK